MLSIYPLSSRPQYRLAKVSIVAPLVFFLLLAFTSVLAIGQTNNGQTNKDQTSKDNQSLQSDVSALRQEVDDLKLQLQSVQTSKQGSTSSNSGNRFNPEIGVIFQGQAWRYQHSPDDYRIQGFPFGGEAGPIEEGFSLGETEIDISANVDDKFTAWLTAPIVIEDGEGAVEIEEAWIETTALPAGLSLRLGRFFSGIGYLNSKHAHAWDFADQALPYQVFLGDQYLDDGIQARWLAPLDIYLELGAEVLRGDRFPAGGADNSGFGSNSLFVNTGGDIGHDSSWLAGLSLLQTKSTERPSGDEDNPFLFTGDTNTLIAHWVWKWAPNGNWKQRNLVVQAEYIRQNSEGNYLLPTGPTVNYDEGQQGSYIQALYQPFPQWRFGVRFDHLSADRVDGAFDGSDLATPSSEPRRYTLMTDWSNSEFSRLRLQYTQDKSGAKSDNQWGLQYIFSIGAHGAHSF